MQEQKAGGAPSAGPAAPKAPNMGLPGAIFRIFKLPKKYFILEGKFGVNNILFVQDLPQEANEEMLSMLFNQFDGLVFKSLTPMGKPSPEGTVVKNSFDDNAHVVH